MLSRKLKVFVLLILFSLPIGLTDCSGGNQLPEPVCKYGTYVADLGEYLCQTVPAIPPEICTLIHLAKINLAILCDENSTEGDKIAATLSLDNINQKLSVALNKMQSDNKLSQKPSN